MPEGAIPLLEGLVDLGITTKGTGADNIRNVTGSPTAGIDAQELLDTRPYARAWHHHILNDRSLYGLPRKFNVGFDGGGVIPVLEDTNDIAFTAVTVAEGAGVDAGRAGSGSASAASPATRTSPSTAASTSSRRRPWRWPTPSCACSSPTATAPTARRRASSTCSTPGASTSSSPRWRRSSAPSWCASRPTRCQRPTARTAARTSAFMRRSRRARSGPAWRCPVGKLTCEQMRGLASIARELGDGDIRLTVWQNLLISGIAQENTALVEAVPGRDRPHRQGHQRARRADRLHRQHRLQVRALQHQGHGDGDRRLGGAARSPSTAPSTSISPAAPTPAPSTTSATSA